MSRITRQLVSALVTATMLSNPLVAQAGGGSRAGNPPGNAGISQVPAGPGCKQPSPTGHPPGFHPTSINNNIQVYNQTTIDNNISVYKPVSINKNINITTNIDNTKNITINKPISIINNIDNSKNINITNNIDNSKYIDNSKNINISKSIVINKGGSEADAAAIAAAIAEASASASASAAAIASALANSNSNSNSSASINFSGGSNTASATSNSAGFSASNGFSTSGSSAGTVGSSFALEAPAPFVGGDIGNIAVEIAPAPAAPQQCTIQEATVVKAIHAICVSGDGHEFPASHMLGDTWINSSYEGEVARCIPGSHLKIVMGKVTQSTEGMATSNASGQVLQCAAHEALRHYKDGVLKCAPATPVPDCTERTNLRRYGTGDMFFTYRSKICLETREEYAEQTTPVDAANQSRSRAHVTAY